MLADVVNKNCKLIFNSRKLIFNSRKLIYNSRKLIYNSRKLIFNSRKLIYNSRKLIFNSRKLIYNSRKLIYNSRKLIWFTKKNNPEMMAGEEESILSKYSSLLSERKHQQFSTKLTISSCFGLKSSFEDTETYFFKWNSIFPLRRTAKRRLRKSSKLYLVCYFSHRFILERNEFEDVLIIWDKESNGSMYLYLLFESALYLRMTIWEPKSQIQEFLISLLWCLWVGNDCQ
jgi:hypothetical protein